MGRYNPSQPTAPPMPTPPKDLVCCITKKLMRKPFTAADGETYEKEAILKHFQNYDREAEGSQLLSPKTGNPLESTNLIENWNIKNNIDEWLGHNPSYDMNAIVKFNDMS